MVNNMEMASDPCAEEFILDMDSLNKTPHQYCYKCMVEMSKQGNGHVCPKCGFSH